MQNKLVDRAVNQAIKLLVILGFITLPYTHFKWMPDLGTTRPVSAVFFALAFGLVFLQVLLENGLNLKAWLHWPKTWDNWPMLRWWVGLIGLGILSAAITPLYGLPIQALTRLLGYFAIFITLFMAAYSLPRYGIQSIARWILYGYLPIMVYAVIEVAGILGQAWATQFVLWFRRELIVPFNYGGRISLMATEPSFVGFQLLLLAFLLPYVPQKWLRWCGWVLVIISLVFTQSGTILALAGVYLVLWWLFSRSRRFLRGLALGTTGLGSVALLANWLILAVSQTINRLVGALFSVDRLQNMTISGQIRLNYVLNLVYAIWETKGLGLGIGQYGYFWKEIYLRHIDYTQFDPTGEMARALTTNGDYMKPWSVLLGIGVDLGIVGLVLLVGFLWDVYRVLSEPRHRALFFACLVALAGAYPIVTPHVWLALGLMAGIGIMKIQERVTG